MSLSIEKKLEDIFLGGVAVKNVKIDQSVDELEKQLAILLQKRKEPLSEEEEHVRQSVRKMLRRGVYRPTGRSKPASEYLIRAALNDKFPRINIAVDTINYLSLKYLVPISLWDTDLAASEQYIFRLGTEDERYIFNSADQEIKLHDLITGFCMRDGKEQAMVNPVKDSLATKTTPESQNVAMVIYYPFADDGILAQMLEEFRGIMQNVGEVLPGVIC
ncbi:phenylalanine--tRNA ligase beta subunit-related protein [Candidatus Uabimicrobium amorphum]|uniref:B3/B4 tRNA-binding domain-containing protein n=1 Tax=Uabimicrobium amorphum TaxID=2596890 RepID=A0A5S9F222_UABAM|nr:phenylalanine--tRNA ligase beta subunit-related protein [Candidatus Uabimicrobium amorphum]BBM83166.1 hypothetical protein UABAM_01517 [Candidatus Uabimicrobium amorphum]